MTIRFCSSFMPVTKNKAPDSSAGEFRMRNEFPITAVILAAGLSKRMGRLKPLLSLGGYRVIEWVVRCFQDAGIEDILVVVGHRGQEIRQAVAALKVRCVDNPEYSDGMFSSVRVGLRALPRGCRAFFIHPVDIPLLRSQTVGQLAASFKAASAAVVYPTFDGRRGHPPLIDYDLIPKLLQWPGTGGLRAFLQHWDAESREIAVADEAILMDLDTPGDYRRMQDRLLHVDLPSTQECRVLMTEIQALPPTILAHSWAVAAVARCLAAALNEAGTPIDVEQVRTAALLHDIARMEKDHALAGARLLELHGLPRIAPIVATHMDIEVKADTPIDEAQVVFLADKLVGSDRFVDLEHRFALKLEKYSRDVSAYEAIVRKRDSARCIQNKLERITGLSLDQLIATIGAIDEWDQ
jgi:putative nucleotidyltransferase with HDIG domain